MSVAEPSGSPASRGYGPDAYCIHCARRIFHWAGKWVHIETQREEC